jgi:hypothetical protein
METSIKANGKMIKRMAKELLPMTMEINMKVTIKMIKDVEKVFIIIKIILFILVNGKII